MGEGARHAVKGSAGLPYWPRILRREQAAAYVGVSAGTFDIEVKEGRAPPPVFVTATLKGLDRDDLDRWIDEWKAAQAAPDNPWDR